MVWLESVKNIKISCYMVFDNCMATYLCMLIRNELAINYKERLYHVVNDDAVAL